MAHDNGSTNGHLAAPRIYPSFESPTVDKVMVEERAAALGKRSIKKSAKEAGLKLAVWPRGSLAHDTGLATSHPSPTEFSIGHNVSSEGEVDEVMRRAEQAGARIVKPARRTFWGGYAGYFQDPDQHLWEIVFNPGLISDD